MFCPDCGTKLGETAQFCGSCGRSLSSASEYKATQETSPVSSFPKKKKPFFSLKAIIWILIIAGFAAYNAHDSANQNAISINNQGLNNFESGNNQQAISDLNSASQQAVSNDTKVSTLKNLAYAYEANDRNAQALSAFEQALPLTSQGSLDNYFISGEIALLQNNPSTALSDFLQANRIDPNDYQVNNSLALFYLNSDGSSTGYEDYPKALQYAQKAYSADQGEISRENFAFANLMNDNYDKAISLYSQSNINQHPTVALNMGLAYAGKNDVANAKYYFQKAIDLGVQVPFQVKNYLNSN